MKKSDIEIVKQAVKEAGFYKYNDDHIFRKAYEILTVALQDQPKKTAPKNKATTKKGKK